jgi:protein-L-isoaspartate(D-aspartate) O-methyltransferase
MLMITRRGDDATRYAARSLMQVSFIPCSAHAMRRHRRRCARRSTRDALRAIRSLRRHTRPDDTVWCAGKGWWLSTADPDA